MLPLIFSGNVSFLTEDVKKHKEVRTDSSTDLHIMILPRKDKIPGLFYMQALSQSWHFMQTPADLSGVLDFRQN